MTMATCQISFFTQRILSRASIFRLVCTPAAGYFHLYHISAVMVCSSSFQPTGVCVSPSPHPPCCKRSGRPGDPPSALLCFQSEWAPFRLFSRSVYPGDEAAVDSGIKSCQLRWHAANNALPSANPCGP